MSEALGDLSTIHYGKSPNEVFDSDGPIPVIGTGGEYGRANKALFSSGIVVPRKGSLGNPQLVLEPFWATDTTFALIPNRDVATRWLYYNLLRFDLTRLNEATGVPSISRDWLSRLTFFQPGFDRQNRIADILQTIDQAIEKTEALIEKYKQIKAGLLQDLFIRGIGPDGKLRPPREQAPELYQQTPIGWIPKEWRVGLLDDIVNPGRPIVYGILMPGYGFDGGVPVVKVKDIVDRRIDVDNLLLTSPKIDHEYRRSRLQTGDLLMTIRRSVGRICVVPAELDGANITQDTARISVSNGEPNFYSYFLESVAAKRHFDVNTLGQAVQGINLGEVRKTPIVIPKKDEQRDICARIDLILKKLETERSLLLELSKQKAGLMHDLLTGKVPVNPGPPEPADA
jgi:type I restriction enzyme S subunit